MNTRIRRMAFLQPVVTRLRESRGRVAAKLHPFRQQMIGRWQGLSPREHKQVALMLVILVSALLWLLLIKPALNTRQHWQQELPRLRSQQAALHTLLGQATTADSQATPPRQRIDASLNHAGLHGGQIREAGASVVVTFARPVEAARLMTWLLNTPITPGMTVQEVTIDRADAGENAAESAARVVASVTLAAQ